MPNLFCHVTPLIGWHVINSLACTVGCHLHGNKSLLLTVGGGEAHRTVCLASANIPLSHPYQVPRLQPVWSERSNRHFQVADHID